MSKRKIYFTGSEDASLVFHAKHRKDGSAKMYVYPIRYKTKTRQPVDYRDYSKKDAIAVFNFENRDALENLMIFLRNMRDNMVGQEGYQYGYQRGLVEGAEVNEIASLLQGFGRPKVTQVRVQTGSDFKDMPDEVFAALGKLVANEAARRLKEHEGTENLKKEKEKAAESVTS